MLKQRASYFGLDKTDTFKEYKEKYLKVNINNGTINTENIVLELVSNPSKLSSFTPASLKTALEQSGYEVKPLSKGAFKGVSFEDDGGYKINFDGDGLIQYHPAKHSHHETAYYKISTGKGGTHRYGLDGKEKKD